MDEAGARSSNGHEIWPEGDGSRDLQAVASTSLTYIGLAVSIAVLYAAVVVGPFLLLDRATTDGPGFALPIAATALVALLFEPLRSRLQRLANRVVYGERATPLEVLSQLTMQLANSSEQGTDALARLAAQGSGAERVIVWVLLGDVLHPHGSWPPFAFADAEPIPLAAVRQDSRHAVELIQHDDEVLGALSIAKGANEPISVADRALVADVAAGSGLVLRNLGLNAELEARARQVRSSRKRLIAARDAERQRLERDLHDGAQQHVVALKVKLGLAKAVAVRDEHDQIIERLDELASSTQDAVDALRSIAHGIYPPLLEAEGLGPTLASIKEPNGLGLVIEADGLGRLSRRIEETVYFCVLELINAVSQAKGDRLHVAVTKGGQRLELEAEADVAVELMAATAIVDRLDAADGSVVMASTDDGGGGLEIVLPVEEAASV